jgi:hypothetical protein
MQMVTGRLPNFASKLGANGVLLGIALAAASVFSCATSSPAESGSATSTGARPSSPESASAERATPASADVLPSASAKAAREAAARRYADLVNDLSEKDTYFFSDNLISNETSYLQIADELEKLSDPTSVYVGVGPEQNFSYIALARPSTAFIVDIRRANMLLHLLYRASFEEAQSRSHFAALLLGRAHDTAHTNAADATIDQVLESASKGEATPETFKAANAALMKRIKGYGVKLSAEDEKGIEKMHKTFFDEQLGIRFELHEKNGRAYPTLRELLKTESPSGKTGGFLAKEDSFRFLQEMQRAGKIVPIVGDFAGDHALAQLASYLKSESKNVGVFYVSNVEQYLLEPKIWKKWVRNVKALPKTEKALFLRGYLDQGKKHPKQLKGQRTATVLSKISDFETRFGDKPTATFYALSTEDLVAPK